MTHLITHTKQLFDFQSTCINNINAAISQGDRRLVLISLMGSGKTVMAAALIKQYCQQNKRVLLLVDLTVLINQLSEELSEWGIAHTVLQSTHPYNPSDQVIIASAQTVDARLKAGNSIEDLLGDIDLLLYDEGHNLTYRQVAKSLYKHYTVHSTAALIGLTATPWRLNPKEYLGEYYDRSVVTLQPPDLIKLGRAVPCRIFGFEDYFDLDRIATDADGDYNEADMASQGITTQNLEKVYSQWVKLTPGQSTIAFAATVAHAQAIADYFNAQGVVSACITGDTTQRERDALFARLKDGSLKLLTSINTLTAGFNCPIVSCILYIRLTRSKALYHQATGRGARVYPGKDYFYILDFGANYRRLGNPMSYQDYSIEPKGGGFKERTKVCPGCGESISTFAKICPHCGYEFKAKKEEEKFDFEYEEPEYDVDAEMIEFFIGSEELICYGSLFHETFLNC